MQGDIEVTIDMLQASLHDARVALVLAAAAIKGESIAKP